MLWPAGVHGQELNYTHYTVESGLQLPSNEVYGIVFDRNNVLWATTDHGVWRYDGTTSRQFTVNNGLKENANFRIFCDSNNHILVSSINNYLCEIDDDSARQSPMCEIIHRTLPSLTSGFIQQIATHADGSIYLSLNRPGLWHFNKTSKELMLQHKVNHTDATIAIHYTPDQFYWDMPAFPNQNPNFRTQVVQDKDWIYLKFGLKDPMNHYRKDLSPISENEFLFSYGNRAFHIKNGALVAERTFNQEITAIYADKNHNFWIGLNLEGVQRFKNGDLKTLPQHFLRGETITGIAVDHEGNFWFSSSTNGIFQANTLDVVLYGNITTNNKDNDMRSIASGGKNIYLGTETGMLLKGKASTNHEYTFKPIKLPCKTGPIRKLFYTSDNHLIILADCLMEIDTAGHLQGIRKVPQYAFDCAKSKDDTWLVSSTYRIEVIKNGQLRYQLDTSNFRTTTSDDSVLSGGIVRARSIFLDSHGTFWLGSQNFGLFSSQGSVFFPWLKKDTLLGRRVHDIRQAGDNIWVSIADYGLVVIRPDSSFIRITEKDSLSSDIVESLFPESSEIVWAGTNNGLNRIIWPAGAQKPDRIDHFTMREGLPTNRIYQIIKHDGCIWVATTQGAVRLNPGFSNPPAILPKIAAGPLLVNGKPRNLNNFVTLGPDDNDLVFNYKAISYRRPSSIRFRYQLHGIDKAAITTENLEARYPDLPYGKYVFSVNATYNGQFDPTTEKHFHIEIRKHWYQTNVFRGFISLILAGFILAGFMQVLATTKRREKEKRQLLQAEKRALLSQMNPHFIFNSLNSIQHFIIQKDDVQANNYLTDFSGLIRRILENSKKNLIPLYEEISTLSLYLNMEKMRFENGFEFQIAKDHRIDYNETMIPPMLIQPLLENAIWHGLMPMKSGGKLSISFTYEVTYFHVHVEDNGIGREKAAQMKIKKGPHSSTGLKNIEERIALLNKIHKKSISMIINDLHDSEGNVSGTSVELFLPIDLN